MEEGDILRRVRDYVLLRCRDSGNGFERSLEQCMAHTAFLRRYTATDQFIVELSVYVSTLYAMYNNGSPFYHRKTDTLPEQHLENLGVAEDDIEHVLRCLALSPTHHPEAKKTIEERVVQCALSMQFITSPTHFLFSKAQEMAYPEAVEVTRRELRRRYHAITLPHARRRIRGEYKRAKELLGFR